METSEDVNLARTLSSDHAINSADPQSAVLNEHILFFLNVALDTGQTERSFSSTCLETHNKFVPFH